MRLMLTFFTNAAFSHCCCQKIYLATFEAFALNFIAVVAVVLMLLLSNDNARHAVANNDGASNFFLYKC